jgi:hypothetical protein
MSAIVESDTPNSAAAFFMESPLSILRLRKTYAFLVKMIFWLSCFMLSGLRFPV